MTHLKRLEQVTKKQIPSPGFTASKFSLPKLCPTARRSTLPDRTTLPNNVSTCK
jgi:hypothetical protein